METIKISWDDIEKKCKTLASRLKEDDFLPGVIIAISRGGTIIGTILSELLNIDMAVVSTKRYKDKIGSDYKTNYNIAFHRDFKRGERILLVDDIYDEGTTIDLTCSWLLKQLPNNTIYKTTLITKIQKKELIYVTSVDKNTWIKFPWEEEK